MKGYIKSERLYETSDESVRRHRWTRINDDGSRNEGVKTIVIPCVEGRRERAGLHIQPR